MAIRLFIDGAAGTTGLEIRERLQGRGEFELLVLDGARRKDEAARRDALHAADIAILCLPDEAAKDAVKLVEGGSTRIIDASSAHRVAPGWIYGFPELIGHDAIANARFVTNPGCYPTGFLALIAPLVRAGMLPADWPYTVNAVSGYSVGGNALIARFGKEGAPAFRAYGYDMAHKHRPEMKRYAELEHGVIFAPAVVPAYRGMVVEVPLHLGAMPNAPVANHLRAALQDFYAQSPIISVADDAAPEELLIERSAPPSDSMTLHVIGNEGEWHARFVAQLDNLGKGASGAAIQNLNIMCGLPETTGLRL